MKPRTKKEKLIVKLSEKLGGIGKRDERNIIKNTYGSCAYDDMYNRCYAVVNQSYQGWQVLRYFRITRHRDRKRNVSYSTWEVMQFWSKVGEGQVFLSRQRTMGMYVDTFLYNSPLEVRKHHVGYSGMDVADLPYDYIYEKSADGAFKYISSYALDNIERHKVYEFLARNKFAETILALQPTIAKAMIQRGCKEDFYFQAVRIAIRHNYNPFAFITDNSAVWACYLDMVKALHKIGKDLHNPFYVCPEGFQGMHDWAIDKMNGVNSKKAEKEQLSENIKKYNVSYVSRRRRFFDMEITDGLISCKVLQSVKDFYEEGKHMHHCVYKSQYYKHPYSIILSAKIGEKRVETVEVDMRTWKVIQCFGACDKFTIYHDRIKNLVNSQMETIKAFNSNKNVKLNKIAV